MVCSIARQLLYRERLNERQGDSRLYQRFLGSVASKVSMRCAGLQRRSRIFHIFCRCLQISRAMLLGSVCTEIYDIGVFVVFRGFTESSIKTSYRLENESSSDFLYEIQTPNGISFRFDLCNRFYFKYIVPCHFLFASTKPGIPSIKWSLVSNIWRSYFGLCWPFRTRISVKVRKFYLLSLSEYEWIGKRGNVQCM